MASFSDLLLYAPARSGDKLQVVGQVRPTTAQTLYRDDYVGRFTDEIERRHIEEMLERTGWVIEGERGAAAALGLSASTLRSRMRKHGIRRPGPTGPALP